MTALAGVELESLVSEPDALTTRLLDYSRSRKQLAVKFTKTDKIYTSCFYMISTCPLIF